MTMILAWAKADEHVLMTFDDLILYGQGDKWQPAPEDLLPVESKGRPKVVQLTDRVLMGTAGDLFLGDALKRSLKVSPDADLEEAFKAAQDLLNPLARVPEILRGNLGIVMCGFLKDGMTGIAVMDSETNEFTLTRADDCLTEGVPLTFATATPYGIEHKAIEKNCIFARGTVAAESNLAGCFLRSFSAHHYLGKDRPDRVSERLHLQVLCQPKERRWSQQPLRLAADVDCSNLEAAGRIHQQLQDLELYLQAELCSKGA